MSIPRFYAWLSRLWTLRHIGSPLKPDAYPVPRTLHEAQQQLRQTGLILKTHPGAIEVAVRALAFGRLRVQDVMVPRNQVHALNQDATREELRRAVLEDGHSHMPVYRDTLDHVVGILMVKDLLAMAWDKDLFVLSDLLAEPYFAPESMSAADLLRELQRRRLHFAVAVDELGGTAGIVGLEDLLEELVGDIRGDCDVASPTPYTREADGAVTLQGTWPVRDANRELKLELPESEHCSTVGGLCVRLAGRIPETGHKFHVACGRTLEIVEASPKHVRVVRVLPQGSSRSPKLGKAPAHLNPETS